MRARKLYFFALATVFAAPAIIAAEKVESPKPTLRAWLAEECPSTPAPAVVEPRFGGLEKVASWGVSFVFDKIGAALKEAAKVDKEGMATTATSPGYLFRYVADAASRVAPQGCVVVAYASSQPRRWCQSEPFKSSRSCERNATDADQTRLEALVQSVEGVPALTGAAVPVFYSEIELIAASDARGFIPRLQALYYTGGMHESRKFKGTTPRNLLINVSAKTPSGTVALSTVSVHLRQFIPSAELLTRIPGAPHATLDKAVDPFWVDLIRVQRYRSPPTKGALVYPVNLAVEVREVGKPNAFLQALASEFDADAATNFARGYFPSQQAEVEAQAEITALSGDVRYQDAISEAHGAEAKLRDACKKPTTEAPDTGKAEILQAIATVRGKRSKVRSIELELGITPFQSFSPEIPADAQNAANAIAICDRIGPI